MSLTGQWHERSIENARLCKGVHPTFADGKARNVGAFAPSELAEGYLFVMSASADTVVMLGNQQYCYPLTITDYCSRYLLACEGLSSTRSEFAFAVFERV